MLPIVRLSFLIIIVTFLLNPYYKFYSCIRRHRTKHYDVKKFNNELDFINPNVEDDTPNVKLNFQNEEDTPSVHSVSIPFKECGDRPATPVHVPEPEKEESV